MALTSPIQVTAGLTIERHSTSSMETCMFYFGWLLGIHRVESFLFLSVKLQNGYWDKKMLPESTSIKLWLVNGWNINFGRATPFNGCISSFLQYVICSPLQHMVTDSYPSLMLKLSRGHIHHAGRQCLASCARRCARRMVSAAGHTRASLPFHPRW